MSYRKLVLILIAALVIAGVSYVQRRGNQVADPLPDNGSADLAPAPQMKTTDELIAFWRGRFDRDPQDFISLTYLGETFIRQGRETGDVAAYDRAEAALDKVLAIHPGDDAALLYLSAVHYVKHDFQGALDLAARISSADLRMTQALATVGDAQAELGNYDSAATAYHQLLEHNPGPAVYSRLAHLAWLQGQPNEAKDQMRRAADEAKDSDVSGESLAWYQFQLGELAFNTGQLDQAADNYRAALASFKHYYLALAGLGKVSAAQGHYDEAIAYYQQAIAIVPQPDFLAALGDLYTLTGQPQQAKQQYDTVEVIGKLAAINKVIYNRQLALFYANHDRKLAEALDFTTHELAVRKDVYGYDAQAWTLYKNGRYQEAAAMMTQAQHLGTTDPLFYYHAGMIAWRLGHIDQARASLTQALSLNPHFDLLQSRIAQATLNQLSSS